MKDLKFCFNSKLPDVNKVKFIVVGDNPGETEYKENRYFIGSSGTSLKNSFENNGWVEDFYEECFIFNKTVIHTNKTPELRPIKKAHPDLFNEIQIKSAQQILETAKEYALPILVFGKTEIRKNGVFSEFWKELNKSEDANIYVFNHPSNSTFMKAAYNVFGKENLISKEELLSWGADNKKLVL